MKTLLIAGAAVVALAAGVAAAQPVAAPAQAMRDGIQTRGEVVQRVRDHFARMDLNRDGFLTRDEGQAAMRQMRGQRTGQRGGRQVDPARRAQRQAQAFDRLDLNHNGVITREEFAQARTMVGEMHGRMRGPGMGMRGAMRMRGAMGGRMFAMADLNRDNCVSMQEATDAALRHFDMADVNRDGRVTREERMQMHQRMMQQRPARG